MMRGHGETIWNEQRYPYLEGPEELQPRNSARADIYIIFHLSSPSGTWTFPIPYLLTLSLITEPTSPISRRP